MAATPPPPAGPPAQDPRNVITPDAFRIDPGLLGTALARPWRRAAAMAVDGVLIAILANAPSVLFGLAGAFVLFRASARPTDQGYLRRSIRLTLRFWGAVVLFAVLVSLAGKADDARRALLSDEPPEPAAARDPQDRGPEAGTAPSAHRSPASADGLPEGEPPDSLAVRLTAALAAGDTLGAADLRERLALVLAADTIGELNRELSRSRERREEVEADLREAEEEGSGVLGLLRSLADDLGLGFGWAGLYFTASLALWKGYTPGKRVFRVRVIRLDGKPIGWWIAFERFGGYAASLATGLLGFLQILWDRNRQGIHDKITETVVVEEQI